MEGVLAIISLSLLASLIKLLHAPEVLIGERRSKKALVRLFFGTKFFSEVSITSKGILLFYSIK